jgi:uncharacterized membrane protein (DUF106 family)
MEKSIKISTSEILKWLGFFALIISTFVVNQVDISQLKADRDELKRENKEMREVQKVQGEAVANMNGKLESIQKDVTTIKDAVINGVFNPRR